MNRTNFVLCLLTFLLLHFLICCAVFSYGPMIVLWVGASTTCVAFALIGKRFQSLAVTVGISGIVVTLLMFGYYVKEIPKEFVEALVAAECAHEYFEVFDKDFSGYLTLDEVEKSRSGFDKGSSGWKHLTHVIDHWKLIGHYRPVGEGDSRHLEVTVTKEDLLDYSLRFRDRYIWWL